jgi:hypothetical protein
LDAINGLRDVGRKNGIVALQIGRVVASVAHAVGVCHTLCGMTIGAP